MDTYPIPARSRVFAAYGRLRARPVASSRRSTPASVAGRVAGPESWRWVFWLLSLTGIPVVLGLLCIKEPRRGRNEMQAVLGQELAEDEGELPISVSVAFERLRKIRSFYFFLAGMAALGFALFSVPLFMNLYLEDELGLSAWERGVFGALVVIPGVAALAIAAPRADRLFRRSPPAAVGFMGALVGRLRRVHRRRSLHAVGGPGRALLRHRHRHVAGRLHRRRADHVVGDPVPPPLPRHRHGRASTSSCSEGSSAPCSPACSPTPSAGAGALTLIVLPSTLIGGALISYGARYIRGDISRCVEELLEEKEEADRVRRGDGATPAVQVRNLDFSYGSVQVLFDINLDVAEGETVALLGTNGAGKSTFSG